MFDDVCQPISNAAEVHQKGHQFSREIHQTLLLVRIRQTLSENIINFTRMSSWERTPRSQFSMNRLRISAGFAWAGDASLPACKNEDSARIPK